MPRRYYTYQIMSNSGFGSVTIKRGDISINISQKYITSSGKIHKRILEPLHNNDYEKLTSLGVKVTYKG